MVARNEVGVAQSTHIDTEHDVSVPVPINQTPSSFQPFSNAMGRFQFTLLIALLLAYTAVSSMRTALFFPYIRTLIHCQSHIMSNQGDDSNSKFWSGSMHCLDKERVARDAGVIFGLAMGTNLFTQFICTSAFGVLGDTYGRKPFIVLSFVGVLAECWLNAVFPSIFSLFVGRFIQGCTGAFFSMAHAVIADISIPTQRAALFSVYQFFFFFTFALGATLTNVMCIAAHNYDYVPIWTLLAIVGAISIVGSSIYFRETLLSCTSTESQDATRILHTSWSQLVPFVAVSRLPHRSFVYNIVGIVIFHCLGHASVVTIPAFSVEVYSWVQETAMYLHIASWAVGSLSSLSGVLLLPQWGSRRVMHAGIYFSLLGQFVLCFSQISPIFLIAGPLIEAPARIATPAYLHEISIRSHSAEQATAQSAISQAFLLAMAIGNVFHAILGRNLPNSLLYLPFVFGCVFTLMALALVMRLVARFPSSRVQLPSESHPKHCATEHVPARLTDHHDSTMNDIALYPKTKQGFIRLL